MIHHSQQGKYMYGIENEATIAEALAFKLGDEEYGIDILKVQEIRGYDAVTKIANAPEFIKGVINLRGIIVPIVDMRIKIRLDRVSDVISLSQEQIRPAPDMGTALNTDYLIGLGTLDERMIFLVDIDRLMSSSEIGMIEKLAA